MLIWVEGGREKTNSPKTHRERRKKTGKKYVVAVGGGGGEKTERVSDYAILPHSSLVETLRESALRPDYD